MNYSVSRFESGESFCFAVHLGPMLLEEGCVDTDTEREAAIAAALSAAPSMTVETVDQSGDPVPPAGAVVVPLFHCQSKGWATSGRFEFAFGDGTNEETESSVNESALGVPAGWTMSVEVVTTRSKTSGRARYELYLGDTDGSDLDATGFVIGHSGYAGEETGEVKIVGPASVTVKTTAVSSPRPVDVTLAAFGTFEPS